MFNKLLKIFSISDSLIPSISDGNVQKNVLTNKTSTSLPMSFKQRIIYCINKHIYSKPKVGKII